MNSAAIVVDILTTTGNIYQLISLSLVFLTNQIVKENGRFTTKIKLELDVFLKFLSLQILSRNAQPIHNESQMEFVVNLTKISSLYPR